MKMKILAGVLSVFAVSAVQAAWINPFQVTGTASTGPNSSVGVDNWVLSATGGAGSVENRTPPTGDAVTVAIGALGANTVTKFLISVPDTGAPHLGQTVSFTGSATLDHAGDSIGYWVNASYNVLGSGIGFKPFNVGPLVLNIGDVFGYQVITDVGGNDNVMNIDMDIINVPEPTTMVLNGIVLVGAAGGYVWNRRRKVS